MTIYGAKLKDPSNVAVLNGIRSNASTEYRTRVPEATTANIKSVLNALTANLPLWNEFEGALVNRIGSVVARNYSWENPLKIFKVGMLEYGDTIEEYSVGLLKAHTYDTDLEFTGKEIWEQEKPEAKSLFHKIGRQEYYKVSVNHDILRRAFLTPNGLSDYVSQLMRSPIESDNWDEFLLMTSLFAEYEERGGYFHVQAPNLNTMSASEADAKYLLKLIRKYTGELKFRRAAYNAAGMPVGADISDMVLFASPDVVANISVEALASAFNVSALEVQPRIIEIPADMFGIDGVQAILTTKDFFVVADTLLNNTSIFNPAGLYNNYFLHHHEVISASLFAPAIMFWTGDTDTLSSRLPVQAQLDPDYGIKVYDVKGDIVNGGNPAEASGVYSVDAKVIALGSGGTTEGAVVDYRVSGNTDTRTSVNSDGVLKIGPAESGSLVVEANVVNSAIDPGPYLTKTVSLTPGSAYYPQSPGTHNDDPIDLAGNNEVVIANESAVAVEITNDSASPIPTREVASGA